MLEYRGELVRPQLLFTVFLTQRTYLLAFTLSCMVLEYRGELARLGL